MSVFNSNINKICFLSRLYVRYNRWSHKGHWTRIFAAIAAEPDLEYLMVDGSIVRVHQHGAVKKTPGCGGDG